MEKKPFLPNKNIRPKSSISYTSGILKNIRASEVKLAEHKAVDNIETEPSLLCKNSKKHCQVNNNLKQLNPFVVFNNFTNKRNQIKTDNIKDTIDFENLFIKKNKIISNLKRQLSSLKKEIQGYEINNYCSLNNYNNYIEYILSNYTNKRNKSSSKPTKQNNSKNIITKQNEKPEKEFSVLLTDNNISPKISSSLNKEKNSLLNLSNFNAQEPRSKNIYSRSKYYETKTYNSSRDKKIINNGYYFNDSKTGKPNTNCISNAKNTNLNRYQKNYQDTLNMLINVNNYIKYIDNNKKNLNANNKSKRNLSEKNKVNYISNDISNKNCAAKADKLDENESSCCGYCTNSNLNTNSNTNSNLNTYSVNNSNNNTMSYDLFKLEKKCQDLFMKYFEYYEIKSKKNTEYEDGNI